MNLKSAEKLEWSIQENGEIVIQHARDSLEKVMSYYGSGKDAYSKEGGGIKWLEKETDQSWKD